MATKAKKKKEELEPIADWTEADQALASIAAAKRQVAHLETELGRKTLALRGPFEERTKPLLEGIARLEKRLEAFTRERREEMGPRKSRQLTFGLVRLYLTPTAIAFKKGKKHTLELLQKLGLTRFVRMVPEVDVEAMHGMEDGELAEVAAKRSRKELFAYDLADDAQALPKPDAGKEGA